MTTSPHPAAAVAFERRRDDWRVSFRASEITRLARSLRPSRPSSSRRAKPLPNLRVLCLPSTGPEVDVAMPGRKDSWTGEQLQVIAVNTGSSA